MSETSHHTHSQSKGEHGATSSYIIGYILSLVFTVIPYYLVVNKIIAGTALLVMILGIAVLQMFIQIIFFLHLGRGPKPLYNIIFFAGTAGTILVVVVGSIWIMNHLNYNMASSDVSKYLAEKEGIYQIDGQKTGACHGVNDNHKVTITGGKVSPVHVNAQLCDTLTFINEDDEERQIGFGEHPDHSGYAGQSDILVRKGRSKSITLNQEGTYIFHDHLNPTVVGYFTVAEQ